MSSLTFLTIAFLATVLRGRGAALVSLTAVDFLTTGFFRVGAFSVVMVSPYGFTSTVYELKESPHEFFKYIEPSDFLTQTFISS